MRRLAQSRSSLVFIFCHLLSAKSVQLASCANLSHHLPPACGPTGSHDSALGAGVWPPVRLSPILKSFPPRLLGFFPVPSLPRWSMGHVFFFASCRGASLCLFFCTPVLVTRRFFSGRSSVSLFLLVLYSCFLRVLAVLGFFEIDL